jgi:integrase/recombinase XerC
MPEMPTHESESPTTIERLLASNQTGTNVVCLHVTVSEREIKGWGTWLRAVGAPDTTIDLRTYHVRRVMREIETDPWSLTTQQLVDYLGSKSWAPETRRSYRASLRAFYRWAQATGKRQDDPAGLIPVVRVPRGVPRPTPEAVYRQACLDADERVELMLNLAAVCGLRRGEIAKVSREDLDQDQAGYALTVSGKGGHARRVPVPEDLAHGILRHPAGYLFPTTAPGGGHLTPHHVGKLVSLVLPEGWTCHTLRHRCATIAYRATHDLRAIQELLGHAKPETTALYTQVPIDSLRAAVAATAA